MKKTSIAIGVLAAAIAIGYPTYRTMFGAEAVQVNVSAQVQKINEYAHPEAFVTPAALNSMMQAGEDVVVIGSLNPVKGDSPISGSFTMWRPDYSASQGAYDFGGMRNSQAEMEQILSSYGATPESTIVVYAANAHHDAARLYWQVKLLGHKDVRYLDGGLNAWLGAGLPTGDANPTVAATSYKAPAASNASLATMEMVLAAQNSDEWVIIDTRGTGEFDGSSTKKGAAGPGAIPGGVHINWTNALAEDTTLKSKAELQAIYGDLIEGKKVITFCQSGVRSAHTQLVLEDVLGAEEVYNYDGSWIEWSYEHYTKHNPQANVLNGNG